MCRSSIQSSPGVGPSTSAAINACDCLEHAHAPERIGLGRDRVRADPRDGQQAPDLCQRPGFHGLQSARRISAVHPGAEECLP